MNVEYSFDYYYGAEAEQFVFYRIPKVLFTDKKFRDLSNDAKILYGLMLDRLGLFLKHGWFDGENRAYIHYTLESIMEDAKLYQELFDVICDVVCVKRKMIRIGGENYPYELVQSRFLKLNSSHLQYVMDCMHNTTTKIINIRAYMITALYNSVSTLSHYYQQEVQHDMYGGGWIEKGII